MANTLLSFFRSPLALNLIIRADSIGLTTLFSQRSRFIYAKTTLGLDGFELQRAKTKNEMINITEKFREKMLEYSSDDSKSMVFTEDLKNMIHLAENDKDIAVVIQMMKRYNHQNSSLRFANYIFGPVAMRMFYIHNKHDLAYECFKSKELSNFFDQYITYQLLLDLLFENQKYTEMLEAVDIIKEKQLKGMKYPKNVVVLACAACYKMNTKESLDYAINLWKELQEVGHQPMRRAVTFSAGLALNQGRPDITLELISTVKNQNYTTIRNLKVAALADIGRIENIIPILKGVLQEDEPQTGGNIHTFNKDVLEKIKQVVVTSDNPEVILDFNRLENIFQKQGNISSITLDEQLCSEIQKPPVTNNRDFQGQMRFQSRNVNRRFQDRGGFRERPGLSEMV